MHRRHHKEEEEEDQNSKPTSSLRLVFRVSVPSLVMFLVKAWRSSAFGVYGYLHFTKSVFLEHAKKFKSEDIETRMEGKNCVVIGANSGICFATAEVNNAGLLENRRVTTSEGINVAITGESCTQCSTVSFGGMYNSPLTTDLQFSDAKFDGVVQYARYKRVQVVLTEKLSETHKGKGVGFYSMHPGWAEFPGVTKSLPDFANT